MQNIWRISMISKQFKKELTMDFYKMQLYHKPNIIPENFNSFDNLFMKIVKLKQNLHKYKDEQGNYDYDKINNDFDYYHTFTDNNINMFTKHYYYDNNINIFNIDYKMTYEYSISSFFEPFDEIMQLYEYFVMKINFEDIYNDLVKKYNEFFDENTILDKMEDLHEYFYNEYFSRHIKEDFPNGYSSQTDYEKMDKLMEEDEDSILEDIDDQMRIEKNNIKTALININGHNTKNNFIDYNTDTIKFSSINIVSAYRFIKFLNAIYSKYMDLFNI